MGTDTFRIVDLEQGSDEWLEWRKGRRTASLAGGVMDTDGRSWDNLRMAEAGLDPEPSDTVKRMFEEGHAGEAAAREHVFTLYEPAVIQSVGHPEYAASLDGLSIHEDGGIHWLEVKTMSSRWGARSSTWQKAIAMSDNPRDRIKPGHWWQLVHQAMVIGQPDATCHFVAWINKDRYCHIVIGAAELLRHVPPLQIEWDRYTSGEVQEVHDPHWNTAALLWLNAKVELEKAKAIEKQARDTLVALAGGKDREGGGVKLTHITSAGAIGWQALAEHLIGDEHVDLDAWRKRERKSIRLSATKTPGKE